MYYIIILDMFRAILCSSSGGQNCIVTASGIVTLCKRPYSAPVESGLQKERKKYIKKELKERKTGRKKERKIYK
jgi:hypothetical protein